MRDLLDYLQEFVMRLIARTLHLTSSNLFLHKLAYGKFLQDGGRLTNFQVHFMAFSRLIRTYSKNKHNIEDHSYMFFQYAVGRKMLRMSFKETT